MSELTPTQKFLKRWRLAGVALVAGLIVGPLVTTGMGWQIRSSTAQATIREAVVREQSAMCELLARQHADNPSQLDDAQRRALAEKYSQFSWEQNADNTVQDRCAASLAK